MLSRVLRADAWEAGNKVLCHSHCVLTVDQHYVIGFLSGIIRQNWNDTEKISMAPCARMTRTSREVIQVFCAFPAMCEHCSCQHVKCCSFLIGGLSNVLLLFVIRLIEICTCCYPPLIIHVQPCTETGLSVSSSGAGGVSWHREGGK